MIQKTKDKHGKMNEEKVWKVLVEVANGLKYLHKGQHFHANLKPSNILVGKEGEVKLSDLHREKTID